MRFAEQRKIAADMASNVSMYPSDIHERLMNEVMQSLRTGKINGIETYRGEMAKQGYVFQTWKSRLFIIVNDAIMLYFKEGKTGLQPKGGAVLLGCSVKSAQVSSAVAHYSSPSQAIPSSVSVVQLSLVLTTVLSVTWNAKSPEKSAQVKGRVWKLVFNAGAPWEEKLKYLRPDRFLYKAGILSSFSSSSLLASSSSSSIPLVEMSKSSTPKPSDSSPPRKLNVCFVMTDNPECGIGRWNWDYANIGFYTAVAALRPTDCYTRIMFGSSVQMSMGDSNTHQIAKPTDVIQHPKHRGSSLMLDALLSGIRAMRIVHEHLSGGEAKDSSEAKEPVYSLLILLTAHDDRGSKATLADVADELAKCPLSEQFRILLLPCGMVGTVYKELEKLNPAFIEFRSFYAPATYPTFQNIKFAFEDRLTKIPSTDE